MIDPLVSTTWLAQHLGDLDVQIIDASWWMPAEKRSGQAEYLGRHIPGAIFFDIDAITDKASDLPHMLPSPEAFAIAAGHLGLRRDAKLVIYDTFGIRSAARVWWTLRVMGFEHVFVLDGGLKAWEANGLQLVSTPTLLRPTRLQTAFRQELVRSAGEVTAILDDQPQQMVDARSAARFRGEVPEPRAGLRGGHMPGARNVPFDRLLTLDGLMKSADEITAVFQAAGVTLGAPIVTTCGSGVTASVLALALARLGYGDVPVYDGSWSEWGGLPDAPIVTG